MARERAGDSTHEEHVGRRAGRGGVILPPGVNHEDLDKIRPATDVRSETTFGLAPVVGDDDSYARAKHGHGTPTAVYPAGLHVRITTQSIPNAAETDIIGDQWEVQGGVTRDGAARLKVPKDGWYILTAEVKWWPSTAGQRRLRILNNNNAVVARANALASSGLQAPEQTALTVRRCLAGEEYRATVFQDSGAALNVEVNADLTVHWLGEQGIY